MSLVTNSPSYSFAETAYANAHAAPLFELKAEYDESGNITSLTVGDGYVLCGQKVCKVIGTGGQAKRTGTFYLEGIKSRKDDSPSKASWKVFLRTSTDEYTASEGEIIERRFRFELFTIDSNGYLASDNRRLICLSTKHNTISKPTPASQTYGCTCDGSKADRLESVIERLKEQKRQLEEYKKTFGETRHNKR